MVRNPFQDSLSVQISGDASGATNAIGGLIGSLGGLKSAALLAGGALAVGFAAKGLASSVRAAADFNQAMQQSVAIMGDVSDTMRTDMEEAARDVARTTTFSAEQAAESYFFLASAGLSAKESIAAIPEVAVFAQAGMFDMATATDLLTDSASALGLEIAEYNRLADVLVSANVQANATVEEFATALTTQAATAMRNANIELEEGIAVLAAWADQGIKGQRAGALFRRTIDQLQKAALDNTEAFEKYNVTVFDTEGNLRQIADIVEDMEDAFEGLSAEQRAAALEQLGFNIRTREGILALMGNSEALREYQAELENSGGVAEEVADKQLESFTSQVKLLDSEITDLKISLGTALLPTLIDIVKALNSGIKALREFKKEADRLGLGFSPVGLLAGGVVTTARDAGFTTESVEFGGRQVQVIKFEGEGPLTQFFADQANEKIGDREERADRLGARGA